jgi:hypothetical protein
VRGIEHDGIFDARDDELRAAAARGTAAATGEEK